MTTNYRTRRVEVIRQNVRRHQQAAEKQEVAERATPAYLQHHGRISGCTPETFLRRRKPVMRTPWIPSEDLDSCGHAPLKLSDDSESRTRTAPFPTCYSNPESPATAPRTPVTVPYHLDTFDEYYDLKPRYMLSYIIPNARAEPEPKSRSASFDEESRSHALSQGISTSKFGIANPHSRFAAPIGLSTRITDLASPPKERKRGPFRRAKAVAQFAEQPAVFRMEKTSRKPGRDSATTGPARAQTSKQPLESLRHSHIPPSLENEAWELSHTGNSSGTSESASPGTMERGIMRMRAIIDIAMCIFAFSLVIVALIGTMSTFATVITAPASW
ncbi:hypothetical protein CERZMDRAFT_92390 [Cercospora zeae-maydis SCOH1-5]|uniref:Uncharacterized protein n=1 Tax=Cercospora zeae-maydis SCOH1-5 TaxID=717836 RepID=A0A6A6FWW5_9PEZI|nr:hypothetical protein CERZMDRAFT_92390 [Cercospora zeae-maydis SCOH1-5]